MTLYNEIDPFASRWLAELVGAGHIAEGIVTPQSIVDLKPEHINGHTQAHFFAGIGVWSYALRLAGWPDDRAIWTGSCPCQPFSVSGKGKGFEDERHLWPEWFRLIRECRPPVIVGEQVASPAGLAWLDSVFADLEGAGYACAASDLCAAGVGAPHIRQRLYFVAIRLADTADKRQLRRRSSKEGDGRGEARVESERLCDAERLGHADSEHTRRLSGAGAEAEGGARLRSDSDSTGASSPALGLVDAIDTRLERHRGHGDEGREPRRLIANPHGPTPTSGFWSSPDWVYCRDGKYRPVEPGTTPLVARAAARVGRLRGYGNAINAEVAATFIRAVMSLL